MKSDNLYLYHILEAMGRIRDFVRDGREAFMSDLKTQDAVIRNLEVIGEAGKRLSIETKDIPWRRMAGFRDVLTHRYEGVILEEVWAIVEGPLPDIEQRIATLLASMDSEQ